MKYGRVQRSTIKMNVLRLYHDGCFTERVMMEACFRKKHNQDECAKNVYNH